MLVHTKDNLQAKSDFQGNDEPKPKTKDSEETTKNYRSKFQNDQAKVHIYTLGSVCEFLYGCGFYLMKVGFNK